MPARIAVGVDGYPEGRDAAVLGAAIARATGAKLMLVAVHPDPLVVLPSEMSWKGLEKQAEAMLRETRDALAPDARIVVETDFSIPRALHRVVGREHRDLLVMGSSRQAPEGRVRIGKRTRQLLCHFECALAVATRGMHEHVDARVTRVGVGFDGGPESQAALALGSAIATAAGAELRVRGVVDDRVPVLARSALGGLVATEWQDVIATEEQRLREQASAAAHAMGATAGVEVLRGRPADALLALSREVDLLVIGSRRWGPAARVLLGSTGEALLHDASSPVIAVPRPPQ
ncbi:MAG: universal stress protein [Solirubrobacteraceae bacterium]